MAKTSNRWTREEEISLMKDIRRGNPFSVLAEKYGRTELALEMRTKKWYMKIWSVGQNQKP